MNGPMTSTPRNNLPWPAGMLALLMWMSLVGSALAQSSEVGEPATPGAAAKAEALDLSDLMVRVEQVAPRIDELTPLLSPVDGESSVQNDLINLALMLDEAERELAAGNGEFLDGDNSEIALTARTLAHTVNDVDKALAVRLTKILSALGEMETAASTWAEVSSSLAEDSVSEDLLNRVSAAQRGLESAIDSFQNRRDEILTLRNSVAQLWVRADEVVANIESWRSQQFLVRTSPPIWDTQKSEHSAEEEPLVEVLKQRMRLVIRFIRDVAPNLVYLIPVALILLILSIVLGKHARTRGQTNERLQRAAQTLSRPISMALLLLVLIMPSSDWPASARSILALLAILPFYRVLMAILPPAAKWTVLPLIVILILSVVRNLLGGGGLADRWIFVITTTSLGLVQWFTLRTQADLLSGEENFSKAWARVPLFALVVVAVLALFAEITGYLNASRALGRGLTTGVYMAFLCYASYRYLSAVTSVLLFSDRAQAFRAMYRHRVQLQEFAWRIFSVGAYAFWVYLVLDSFSLAQDLIQPTREILGATLTVGALSLSLGGFFAFIVTLWVSFLLARAIPAMLEEDVYTRLNMKRGVPFAISTFTRYGLIVVGVIAALSAAGVNLSQTLIVFGALGVGIGFGLQNVVNDFVAGGILLFERPIQVGDIIQLGTLGGKVTRIGPRSSTIETWDGAEVIMPNGQLTSTQLTNWTLSNRRRRIDIDVTVTHGAHPTEVVKTMVEVASAHEGVAKEPPPRALFLRFGENGSIFRLQAWTNDVDTFLGLQSDLNSGISAALREKGIHIPVFLENLRGREGQA